MAGFIYIMSNPSFIAGRVKIGKSDRDPMEFRKVELETTGVPEPFRVEYFAFVDDHHSVEKVVHAALDAFRRNKAREFFDVAIGDAVSVIRANSKIHFEKAFYRAQEPFGCDGGAQRQEDANEAANLGTVVITCDSCGQFLRVPKYRRLNVRCPKCGHEWKDFLFR